MLSQKLYNYFLNTNYSYENTTMSGHNHSTCNERKEFIQIQTKTINRRGPTLTANETLMIEAGMVILVITIVCFVFYCSHRNFKKRTTVHRRRWLESDATVEVYSDGQIYETNTSAEENLPTDLDQHDCPPPYDSVVHQSKRSKSHSSATNNFQKYEQVQNRLDTNLMKPDSGCEDFEFHNCFPSAKSPTEPLIPTCKPNCDAAKDCECSLLIHSGTVASTSPFDQNCTWSKRDEVVTIPQNEVNEEFHNQRQNSYSARTDTELASETSGFDHKDTNIELKVSMECPLLDTTGLPSYDTALKIQGCGNI